jgi:hypothetical protein
VIAMGQKIDDFLINSFTEKINRYLINILIINRTGFDVPEVLVTSRLPFPVYCVY